jgi:transcriptional regulator
MSAAALARLLAGIVGFRLHVDRIAGTTKLGQNKPASARAGVMAALDAQDDAARIIAAAMRALHTGDASGAGNTDRAHGAPGAGPTLP